MEFVLVLDPDDPAASGITQAEILLGVNEPELEQIKAFFDQYHFLIVERPVADLSATLQRKYGWKLPNAFQATLASHHNIRL